MWLIVTVAVGFPNHSPTSPNSPTPSLHAVQLQDLLSHPWEPEHFLSFDGTPVAGMMIRCRP